MNHGGFDNTSFLGRITEIIKANLKNEQFGVSLLAREMSMSRSNLHRKIKTETGKTISQFINQVRLTYALELLQNTGLTVSEAAYESGFHSVTYFSTCFHEFYGYPPGKATGNARRPGDPDEAATAPPADSRKNKTGRRQLLPFFVLPVLIAALFVVVYHIPIPLPGTGPVAIAVLQPNAVPADSSGQNLAYALVVQLIKNLSEIENFEVHRINNPLPEGATSKKIQQADYTVECKANHRGEVEVVLKKAGNGKVELSESFLAAGEIFYPAAQIASDIAASINRALSDEERKAFEKAPSSHPYALLNYQLGLSYRFIAEQGISAERHQNLLKAKSLFEEAVKLDSFFTEAYIELGHVYINNLYYFAGSMQQADQYLETGYQLVRKALELDNQNRQALSLSGRYYLRKGMNVQATRIFAGLSKETDPGYTRFINEFDVSVHYEDYSNAVQNFFNYERNKPAGELTPKYMLNNVALVFSDTGFPEMAREYAQKLLACYNDSIHFFRLMGTLELRAGNYLKAVAWHRKTAGEQEFSRESHHFFMFSYVVMGDLENAARHLEKWEAAKNGTLRYPSQYYIAGMICRLTGQEEKAFAYFKEAEQHLQEAVLRNTRRSQIYVEQFYLAGVAFELGEDEKAIRYLKLLTGRKTIPQWIILGFESWPPLSGRRYMPEIEGIYQSLLATFNQEHNRVAGLLAKEGLIEPFAQQTAPPD